MDKLKEHLDKIIAVAVILACLGLIAKTHLAERKGGISNDEIERVLTRIKTPRAVPPKVVVPDYAGRFKGFMGKAEVDLAPKLAAWSLYPLGPKVGVVERPRNWTVQAARFPSGDRAAAEGEVGKLKAADLPDVTILQRVLEGQRVLAVCVGRYLKEDDPKALAMTDRLRAMDPRYKQPEVIFVKTDDALDAALGLAWVKPGGVYVNKAIVSFGFSSQDQYCARRLLRLWRKKADEKKWPAEPLVTVELPEGGEAAITPAGRATAAGSGYQVSETELLPREAYEYRALAVATFRKEAESGGQSKAVVPPGSGVKRAPELDESLKGKAYVTAFTPAVKLETPGQVQIQYAGSSGFRFKRFVAGLSAPVTDYDTFKAGDRIKMFKTVRIGNRTERIEIDSEAVLIKTDTEIRPGPTGEKTIPVWNPEKKVMESKTVKYKKPDVKVSVAVIEDVRTGKKHTLDQTRGAEAGWWPKGLAVQAAPDTTPGDGDRRKTPPPKKPPVPKRPPPPKKPPKTPKREPVPVPEPPPPDEVRNPGPMPDTRDPEVLKAWEAKRRAWLEAEKEKQRTQRR